MATQHLSEHVLLITLPAEPQWSSDLDVVVRSTHPAWDCDVIVSFSLVEFLSSATICLLIILERVLSAAGRRLVLCSVSPGAKAILRHVGLHKLFRFTNDPLTALQFLHSGGHVDD